MQEITEFTPADSNLWIRLENHHRFCYYRIPEEWLFPYVPLYYEDALEDRVLYDDVMEIIEKDGFDVSVLPHIEECSTALQYIWHRLTQSDFNHVYIEDNEAELMKCLNLTKAEFISQVDSDIKKYKLQHLITKHQCQVIYECHGDLQSLFSEKNV